MLSTDKSITFGMGVVTAATLYYLGGQNLPTKSLYSTLGGITATTLFQAYYPSCLGSLKEKCGQKLPKAMLCLSSVMVFIGGYLGGLPNRVSLLATSIFMVAQFIGAKIAHPYINEQYKKEGEVLCAQAENAILEGKLSDAETLIEQGDGVEAKRAGLKGFTFAGAITTEEGLDKVKEKLVEAYLKQTPPDIEKAKKNAEAINDESAQINAEITIEIEEIRRAPKSYTVPVALMEKMIKVKPSIEVLQKLIQCKEEAHENESFVLLYLLYGACYIREFGAKISLSNSDSGDPEIMIDKKPSLVLYLLKDAFAFKQNKVARDLVELCSDNDVKIQAAILSAKHFGKENLEAAKLQLQSALDVVQVLSDKDKKLLAFNKIVEVQRDFGLELENAVQVARTFSENRVKGLLITIDALFFTEKEQEAKELLAELEDQFESFSVDNRLEIMKHQAFIKPDSLFLIFEKYRPMLWEKESVYDLCEALLILAKARMERGEITLAKELIAEINIKINNFLGLVGCAKSNEQDFNKLLDNQIRIGVRLVRVRVDLLNLEADIKKKSWFSWAS